jgi:hypothetical protein
MNALPVRRRRGGLRNYRRTSGQRGQPSREVLGPGRCPRRVQIGTAEAEARGDGASGAVQTLGGQSRAPGTLKSVRVGPVFQRDIQADFAEFVLHKRV